MGYNGWWNESWEHRIQVNLTETIGINRSFYVLEQNITPGDILNCQEIRVTQCAEENSSCSGEIEIPSEVLSGDSSWCNIEFVINLTGHSWRHHFVYYGNREVEKKDYGNYRKNYFAELPYRPTDKDLRDMDIVSETEAYAVGGDDLDTKKGRAIKWNGSIWYEVPVSGGTSGSLSGVGFWSSGEGWAAGDHESSGFESSDEIFRWNENLQRWDYTISTDWPSLGDLDVLEKNFAMAGRAWGTVMVWDGSNWKETSSGFWYHAGRVDIISETDAWATGMKDYSNYCGLTHWDGSLWTAQNCPTNNGQGTAIDCWNSGLCFAATSEGNIFEYDGTSWKSVESPSTGGIYGIKFTEPEEAWGCGENGTIIRWNGKAWEKLDNVTNKTLGSLGNSAVIAGDGIDMLNSSYGWIIGEDGIVLHRGSVKVNFGENEEDNSRINLVLEENKKFYLGSEAKIGVTVFYENGTLDDLDENNFELTVNGNYPGFGLENLGEGNHVLVLEDVYGVIGELGKFNLSVRVSFENISGENRTIFQMLKIPGKGIIVSDSDWRNVIAASATGRPVLVGDGNLDGLEGEVFSLGEAEVTDIGDVYRVNDRESLQAMFLNESRKILVKSRMEGIFAARLAHEMDRIIVFEECEGDCIDLSGKSLEELEDFFAEELGRTNYFVLTNIERDNSLLAAQVAVYRKGLPVIVNMDEITYPEKDSMESAEFFNGNNRVSWVRDKMVDKVEKFGKLEKDYAFGVMPKVAIIGTGLDVPHFVLLDMGLEDFVEEPSGDDLWLKTDNVYGDLNSDGFMDAAVGRINRDLDEGSWQLLNIRLFEEKELDAGILAEYNQPAGLDLLTFGGSMMNGFVAHLNLRDYDAERLVEKRAKTSWSIEDEMLDEIKKIIIKEIDKKLFWVYTKLKFSQELLYVLLERNWVDWEIPGVPHRLEEISIADSVDFFENKGMTFFFGPGDTNKIFLYEEERNVYLNPYSGPGIDLRNLEKTGFMYLDYSYSYGLDLPQNSPGSIGNTGLMHDAASRQSLIHFLNNLDKGAGQALAESKNQAGKMELREDRGTRPQEKEFFGKILLTDPALNLGKNFRSEGFFSAEMSRGYFYDEVEIEPKYDGAFLDFSYTILVPNRPLIPVYKGRVILPSGASIKDIKVEKSTRTIENVSIPSFIDKYYLEKSLPGAYPEEEWWKNERKYLDGRKEIIFSVPVVYDPENMIAFVNSFVFRVEYESDLEITDFYAADVIAGEQGKFHLNLYSSDKRDAEIFLKIYGEDSWEISREVELGSGENSVEFAWDKTEKPGKYEAHVVVVSDITIGPRAANFEVMERPNILIRTAEKVVQVWLNLGEELSRTFAGHKIEINNTTPGVRTENRMENGISFSRVTSEDFVLTIKESGFEREIVFTNAKGKFLVREFSGNREELIFGDEKIREDFEKAKNFLKDKTKFAK